MSGWTLGYTSSWHAEVRLQDIIVGDVNTPVKRRPMVKVGANPVWYQGQRWGQQTKRGLQYVVVSYVYRPVERRLAVSITAALFAVAPTAWFADRDPLGIIRM